MPEITKFNELYPFSFAQRSYVNERRRKKKEQPADERFTDVLIQNKKKIRNFIFRVKI